MTKKRYIPALKFGWLTHFYDPLMKLTRSEEKFKKYLLLGFDSVRHILATKFSTNPHLTGSYPQASE